MHRVFKFNFLYFSLLCFIILNLSCEQSDPYAAYVPEDDPFIYFFNIDNEIIDALNPGKDYADTDEDYTEITINLNKTLNGNTSFLVPNEEINISWSITNGAYSLEDYQSFSKMEHIDTVGNVIEISNGESLTVNDSGEATLKWLDNGISGDVIINCSFTDKNQVVWNSSNEDNQLNEAFDNSFKISDVTYNLDVVVDTISVSNHVGDYSDFSNMNKINDGTTSFTEVNISLSKDETNLPATSKLIEINLSGIFDASDGYFLTENSEPVYDADHILTDALGNIKLYWIDEGKSGSRSFESEFAPILGEPIKSQNSFTVISQYEKIDNILPSMYDYGNPINLSDGIPQLYPIQVLVVDEYHNGVEYIDVYLNQGTCNNCPNLLLDNNGISQTNSDGIASFEFDLWDIGVVTDNITLSYTFTVDNPDLVNGPLIETEYLNFEIDNVAPETYEVDVFELRLEPSDFIFNDLPEAVNDSTYSDEIIIEATAKRAGGFPIENLPIYFENIEPASGNSYGTLDEMVVTDENGVATNILRNINTDNLTPSNPIDEIIIRAVTGIDTATATAIIRPQSLENIYKVDDLDFYFLQNINFTVDANGTFTDILIAQVLDDNNAPVEDVPINFTLTTEDIGFISSDTEYSDSLGFAQITFNFNGSDILSAEDLETPFQAPVNITAFINDQFNETLDRIYYVDPVQLISTVELELTPQVLIYNDLPGYEEGTIDTLGISVMVLDDDGVGVPQIPVSFSNETPQYGVLHEDVVTTNEIGIAINKLSNINTTAFDFENNTTDAIEISVFAWGVDASGFETMYPDTSVTTIVPQSLQNIWQVEQLDVYFAQQLSVINNITIAFSDTVVAQVLDENSNPVEGVPINFELVSENEVGYLTNGIGISDENGFARSIFHINPADFEYFDNDATIITINTTVGEDFTDSITKSYQIEGHVNIEYEVAELYPVTYEPLNLIYDFDVYYDNELDAYEHQFKNLCFQTKDTDGVIIENVPVQFSLQSINQNTIGSISDALLYTCCGSEEDSTSTASQFNSNSMMYYEYMYDYIFEASADDAYAETIASDTLGVACITYSAYDISDDEFENPDKLTVSIADPNNQSVNLHQDTYTLGLNAIFPPIISSLDLVLTPDLLIYQDLTLNLGTNDSLIISAYVKDSLGVGMPEIPVYFSNNTPDYGILQTAVVLTDSVGVATNRLININTSSFDFENNTADFIEIEAEAIDFDIDGIETTYSDVSEVAIVPQSLYNIWQVDQLDVYFAQDLSVINNITVVFADTIVAQVLDENSIPVAGVPINFELISDNNVGYLTSQQEVWNPESGDAEYYVLSDEDGFARSVFHINPADFQYFNDETSEITVNISVGESFTDSITKNYAIEGNEYVEYEVEALYPVTYEPTAFVYQFPVYWDNNLGNYQHQFRNLCFQTKDTTGVIVENVPIQFALLNGSQSAPVGVISHALAYTHGSGGDSTNVAPSNNEMYLNYLATTGQDPTAYTSSGIACVQWSAYDLEEIDFETPDSLVISIADPNNQTVDLHSLTYSLGLSAYSGPQTVDPNSFSIIMTPPEILIYNDLPSNIDPTVTDEVNLSVFVADELGSSISNVEIEFTNLTNYGALEQSSVNTNSAGIATNKIYNITQTFDDAFDYENDTSDIITVQVDAKVENQSVATDTESITIVPQSLYNISQVNSLSLNFNDPTNFTIYEADNATFTDQIQAQVLTATNSPYKNVPIEFSLNSNFGWIPSALEYTDSTGIASVVFQLPTSNISQLAIGDQALQISITASVGDFTETINRTYTIMPIPTVGSIDLDAETDTFIFNDIPSSSDTTNQITEIGLLGIIKDEFDAVLGGVTAYFSIIDGGEYADISSSTVDSDSTGYANNKLVNIDTEEFDYNNTSDSIKVKMTVTNNENQEIADTAKVIIIPQSIASISKVDQLDTYFTQQLSTINNVTITISDTLVAQVLDVASTPVLDVPIDFELSSLNNIGYLTNEIGYSDSTGYAYTIYKITPSDFDDFIDNTEEINITVSVGDDISETISRTYVINASTNIEYDVADLTYTYNNPIMPVIGFPDSALVGQYNDITEKYCFSTTDEAGVSISGVPILFELYGNNPIKGSLNSSIMYTYPDSSYDAEADTTCTNTTLGAACVCYNLPIDINSFDSSPDSLRAHIVDPNNQTNDLQILELGIDIASSSSLVDTSFAYAQPSFIAMDVLDSTYCDTIYAIAQSESSSPLKDIPVIFTIDEEDMAYGLISTNYAVTDSLLYPPYIAATTQFCTHPNIDLDGQNVVIDITASIQLSDHTSTVQIPLSEDIPECPDCEESLVITSDYYELPNVDVDGNDIFQANLTATVVDSTENPVPENTLVEWQALKEDETGALSEVIGSIDPYTFTDENGVATTIFSMMNDFGLASIIATAPAFNLADTTFISLTSNEAAYIELIQPTPNEIMVQGGGGIESTELQVEVKDNNGNLVTDDYVVYYRLANNSPSGSYFNEVGTTRTCVNSDNGIASVTLNSGNEPGSVQVIVAAYSLDSDCESIECTDGDSDGFCDDSGNPALALNSSIAQLSFTTVTIVTGSPNSGQINFSYVDILPITGSGLYEVPLSVQLEDVYANPVADSTNVYIWIEGHKPQWCSSENVADEVNFPGLENEDCTFAIGDTVKWGTEAIIDSLLYVLIDDIPFPQPLSEGLAFAPGELNGQQFWLEIAHPGQVVGEAKTGMVAPDGNSYPGIAFSNAYYGTSEIFERTVLKAMTFGANEEMLIIDSRDNHNNEPLLLPFQPGTVSATTSLVTFDFSLPPHNPEAGPACDPGTADTQQVTVTGSLTDFFQYATGDGRLQITAPGATIVSACNPSDTDGDGFVGWCDEDGNGLQGEEELIPTCRDCVAAQLPWIFDDSDGDGLVDDDPAVGITDGTGQVVFIIEFSEVINIQSGPCDAGGGEIVTYDDWQSDVVLQLIDPIQTASNSITITVQKTETD